MKKQSLNAVARAFSTAVLIVGAIGAGADDTISVDAARDIHGRLWFVELTGNPVADGNTATAVQREQAAFRGAAAAARVSYVERRSYDTLFNGFAIEIAPAERMKIAQLPGVKAIYPVEVVLAPTRRRAAGSAPDLASAIQMTGADVAQNSLGLTGRGIKVGIIDTGIDTMTGGRLKRARHLLSDGPFCLTYGDGVSNVNIADLVETHRRLGRWCTLTAVTQPGRYGALRLNNNQSRVDGFREKGIADGGLINGGYFVCEPEVFDLIDGDDTIWEEEPIARLIERGQLSAYHHDGYWQSMDSLRDKELLERTWKEGAPWKVWEESRARVAQ
jgi:glucose-1-phosphate cytidylyltransferase